MRGGERRERRDSKRELKRKREVISTPKYIHLHTPHTNNINELIKYRHNNKAMWYPLVIPAFGKLRREGQKFRVILCHSQF